MQRKIVAMMDDGRLRGLRWVWDDKKIFIVNGSKHIIGVNLGDSQPVFGLDPGRQGLYPISDDTVSVVTLCYYMESRALRSILLHSNDRRWTSSITPMVKASCYTKDRAPMDGMLVTRRTVFARGINYYY